MKVSVIGSGLSAALLATFIFTSSNAVSGPSTAPQSPLTQSPLNKQKKQAASVEANHPLVMAQQQLEQARQHYSKGNIEAVGKSLEAATKWLQGHQTDTEATDLASEIKQLQEKITHPSDDHEGAISRLWHRSSALVSREIEQITKSWHDSSTANQTLKYLIDARMRFSYAEHDLFVNHNTEKARYEIDSTLAYLDKASDVAIPRVREKITTLKKDIQLLPSNNTNAAESQAIMQALKAASISVDKASHSVSPEIQTRSKKIAADLRSLGKDIFLLEKRQQYDSMMKRLQQLDQLL